MLRAFLGAAALVLSLSPASAVTLNFSIALDGDGASLSRLNNTRAPGSGPVTGSLSYDTDSDLFTAVALTTSGVPFSDPSARDYTTLQVEDTNAIFAVDPTNAFALELSFDESALLAASFGSTVEITQLRLLACLDPDCLSKQVNPTLAQSPNFKGSIVAAVPLPPALPAFALVLGVVSAGALRAHRRSAA